VVEICPRAQKPAIFTDGRMTCETGGQRRAGGGVRRVGQDLGRGWGNGMRAADSEEIKFTTYLMV
jgi:hypothetical protein